MDADGFDALTRALVSRRSRRRLVATAAALLGGLLAHAPAPFNGADDALANNKNKKGKGKGKKKKKKPAPCRAGECCTDNKPGCPAGLKCCGESCIDQSLCCVDGAAKIPDCGQTCCQPVEEECCEGTCHNILAPPICNACQERECVSGQGLQCVEKTQGTPCGEECCPTGEECCGLECCPEGQVCCGATYCIDPETQCCGVGGNPGSPCGDGSYGSHLSCCVAALPYRQTCCTVDFPNPGSKACWGLLSPCAACEYFCSGNLCCPTDQECCYGPPAKCIPRGESCSA
ncbi:MAG: hypothetical protein ACRDJC_11025 [Thermomicrobiales bacterium]